MEFDYLVFIGRFQPFHIGHRHVLSEALKLSKKVIMIVGSSDRPRDVRNPFKFSERDAIIRSALEADEFDRVAILPQVDYTYNDEKWIASIQSAVSASIARDGWRSGPTKIGIIGYDKDHSSYYLKKFPHWDLVAVPRVFLIDATMIREALFSDTININTWHVNQAHQNLVKHYIQEHCEKVKEEYSFIINYKKQWAVAPYPPTLVTTDAIVTQSGHILLVQRKAMPGKDLWAMPGGYLAQGMTLLESMLKELFEETSIDVPKPVLVGSIIKNRPYDDPHRSARGRIITHAYHIKLADREQLPKIKGGDDAKRAKWFPLSEFIKMREVMFEDHFNIIENMLGL